MTTYKFGMDEVWGRYALGSGPHAGAAPAAAGLGLARAMAG